MKKVKNFIKNFWLIFSKPEMLILPGQLAFFFLLSIVPILTLISYGSISLHLSMDFISDFLVKSFGENIASMIIPIVKVDKVNLTFFITLLVGYSTASNGAASIIATSNMIYGIQDKGYVYRTIKSFVMTIFIVILFIFILAFPLLGEKIIELIKFVYNNTYIIDKIELVFNLLKGPISLLIVFFFIKILYTMAPDKRIPSSTVNYGAVFTSLGWIISTYIYSYYINNYADFSALYGGLANIVILLLWFYLLAYIFVIGLALNYKKETLELTKTIIIKDVNEKNSNKN